LKVQYVELVPPYYPPTRMYVAAYATGRDSGARPVFDTPKKFPNIELGYIYY